MLPARAGARASAGDVMFRNNTMSTSSRCIQHNARNCEAYLNRFTHSRVMNIGRPISRSTMSSFCSSSSSTRPYMPRTPSACSRPGSSSTSVSVISGEGTAPATATSHASTFVDAPSCFFGNLSRYKPEVYGRSKNIRLNFAGGAPSEPHTRTSRTQQLTLNNRCGDHKSGTLARLSNSTLQGTWLNTKLLHGVASSAVDHSARRAFSSTNERTKGVGAEKKPEKIKRSDKETLLKFASLLWPTSNDQRLRMGCALSSIVLAKLFTVLAPVQLGYLVNHLSSTDLSTIPYALIASYGLCRINTSLFSEIRGYVFARVHQKVVREVSKDAFEKSHSLDINYLQSIQSTAIQSNIIRTMRSIPQVLQAMLFNIVPTILEGGLVLGVLYNTVGIESTLVCTVTFGSYALFTTVYSNYRRSLIKEQNLNEDEVSFRLVNSLQNAEVVKYFDNQRLEVGRLDETLSKFEDCQVKVIRSLSVLNFGQQCIVNGGLMTLMAMATNQVVAGNLQVGDLVAINTLVLQIAQPLNMLGTMYRLVMQGITDMQQLENYVNVEPLVKIKPDCKPFEFKGCEIQFDQVHFGYGPLVNFTATIAPGERIAIVGPSGSGKSTLLKLLYRLYDPAQGRVLIDGQDLRDLDPSSFRQYLGIVPQDTILFNDSVFYNVRYGNPTATKEEVIEACKRAMVHDTILHLDNQYDTLVGDRGASLSGGERQRIGIARCLLKDPQILLLDEATAALDVNTERLFVDALNALNKKKTVIVVAHRLSTIKQCDRILYLDGGRVQEAGSHDELMGLNGLYATLVKQK